MINTIYITLIVVIILDQTDAMDGIKRLLSRFLTNGKVNTSDYSLKPLDCPLCLSWWLNLIYIIAVGKFSLANTVIILLLAISTPIINDIIILAMTAIQRLISLINNIFLKKDNDYDK